MRYSKAFKMKCVRLYHQGKYPKTPDNISSKRFRKEIREWVRMVDSCGWNSLGCKPHNKKWSLEEKLELIQKVLNGQACRSVAICNGINSGMLYGWVRKYKLYGSDGLTRKQGRPTKEHAVNEKPTPLTESEREELIRLRAETSRMRTEIAAIKKEIALREEQEKARLKAKKQRLSENSKKPDTN